MRWTKWIIQNSAFGMRNHENEWEIIRHVECFGIRWDDDALNYALCTAVYLFQLSISLYLTVFTCCKCMSVCMYILVSVWVSVCVLGQHIFGICTLLNIHCIHRVDWFRLMLTHSLVRSLNHVLNKLYKMWRVYVWKCVQMLIWGRK